MAMSTDKVVALSMRINEAIYNGIGLDSIKKMVALHPKVLEVVNEEGRTILHQTCMLYDRSSFDIIEYLVLQSPESVAIRDAEGCTPLHYACSSKLSSEAVVYLLYEHYPEALKMQDYFGRTPLSIACRSAHNDFIEYLILQSPESVAIRDAQGCTPLHYACDSKLSLKVVVLLYEHYPEALKMQDQSGKTPFSLACNSGHNDIITFLVRKWPVATLYRRSHTLISKIPWSLAIDARCDKDVLTCLKETTVAASYALIDTILTLRGSDESWLVICRIIEVFPEINCNEDGFSELAVATPNFDKIQRLLNDKSAESWLENTKHQYLVDGFLKMNAAGRSFLVKDPCNKLKDVEVMASVTGNSECLFLHLRSHQRNKNVDLMYCKKVM